MGLDVSFYVQTLMELSTFATQKIDTGIAYIT